MEFSSKNYFYTSLGNAFVSERETMKNIKELILKHHITNVCFVLSSENEIIMDAIQGRFFDQIKGLDDLYTQIEKERESSEVMFPTASREFSVISYFLNHKIQELAFELGGLSGHNIDFSGQVYSSFEDSFRPIYSPLTCLEKYNLN
jgi:hypothetical protein